MLQSLTIKNIVLIESLYIPFEAGFCVLTGETGAGKSILLDALGLAIGKRADANLVRYGQKQGSVVADFNIENNKAVKQLLSDQGIEIEDTLLLKRVINSDGKSKALVNGEPVSVNFLQQLAQSLIEIHGQHDQRGLMDVSSHCAVLDSYAGNTKLLADIKSSYHQWKDAVKDYDELKAACIKAQEDEEYLRHVLQELRDLSPCENEEEQLAEQRSLMVNSEKIIEALNEASGHLTGKNNVQSALSSAERVLHRTTTQAGDIFEPALQALDRAGIEMAEAINAIEETAREIDISGASLDETEERLFALRAAARKYSISVDGLNVYADDVQSQIGLLESQEQQLDELEKQAQEYRKLYINYAVQLTEIRQQYSTKISNEIGKELVPLKMENAALQVSIEQLDEANWNESGQERVRFLVRTNPGSPFGVLGKIASGGELSRFMLAMKVVLSKVSSVPTLIFDEIDTGIGGATADAVGKRLSKLGQKQQVLSVTHQPQVASYGTHHLRIEKTTTADSTITDVYVLDEAQRNEEIARMLAGQDITTEARAAANKLMGTG